MQTGINYLFCKFSLPYIKYINAFSFENYFEHFQLVTLKVTACKYKTNRHYSIILFVWFTLYQVNYSILLEKKHLKFNKKHFESNRLLYNISNDFYFIFKILA